MILSMLFMAFACRSNTFVAPALAEIAREFPDVSMANIQLIMTFGMIGNFPMTIITGFFADKFRPKPLVIAGCALISIGALYPLIWHGDIWFLYISNLMMGIGQGVVLTYNSILIAQLFEDPTRGQLLGWRNSVQQVGSMLMALVAGYSALLGWYNVYLTGFVTLPSLLIVIFLLPNVEKAETRIAEQSGGVVQKKKLSGQSLLVAVFFFLFGVPFAVNIINSAMLLDTKLGLGPEMAGITSAVTGFASIVGGAVYYPFARFVKSNILWIGTAIVVAGLVTQYFCTNFMLFLVGGCFVLLGFVFTFSGAVHAVPRIDAPAQVAFGIGIVMAFQSLGSMLTPYLINPITRAVYGQDSAAGNYFVAIVWGCVVIVIGIVWAITHKKLYTEESFKGQKAS
jgi:MFS family permease